MGKRAKSLRQSMWISLLLLALVAACQPQPEQLIQQSDLPTLAVIPPTATPTPSLTPSPTITLTPSDTPTPTITPTPTVTRTRPPTFTPIPDDPVAACAETLFNGLAAAQFGCETMERDTICHGSALVDASAQVNFEGNREVFLASTGMQADIADLRGFDTTPLDTDSGLWGAAIVYIGGDMDGPIAPDERITLLAFGGSRVINLVDHPQIQEELRNQFNANNAPPRRYPMSSLEISTAPPSETCPFVPSGVLIQSAASGSRLEVNDVEITFQGTIYITALHNDFLNITTLDGTTTLRFEERRVAVPLGVQGSVPMDENLSPSQNDILFQAYDTQLEQSIFGRASSIQSFLIQEVDLPPAVFQGDIALLNTLDGDWSVDTRVTFLNGLYQEGDNITAGLVGDVIDACSWQGAWLLNSDNTTTFNIQQDINGETIAVGGFYPDVPFPRLLNRDPGEAEIYRGTSIAAGGALYEHVITFPDVNTLEWAVDVNLIGGGLCSVGQIQGTGSRDPEQMVADQPPAAQLIAETWQVVLQEGTGYVPADLVLPNCPTFETFEVPPQSYLIGTLRQSGENTLQLQGTINGIILPEQLTPNPLDPDVYIGIAQVDDQFQAHEVIFEGETRLSWRIMLQSQTDNCRLGVITAVGTRTGQ